MVWCGVMVIGIDLGEVFLVVVCLYVEKSGVEVEYLQVLVEEIVEQCVGEYDVVICLEMFEYVFDLVLVICVCVKLVKFGGQVFFSIINCNFKVFLFVIVGVEYVLRLLLCGIYEYVKLICFLELVGWSCDVGFDVCDIIGMIYNLVIQVYKFNCDVLVNYLMYVVCYV